jgi:Protein of unknown function (DUF1571)
MAATFPCHSRTKTGWQSWLTIGVLGAVAGPLARADEAEPTGPPPGTSYYSTAAPPRDYPGPEPMDLALAAPEPVARGTGLRTESTEPMALADPEPPRPTIPDLAPLEPPRTEPEPAASGIGSRESGVGSEPEPAPAPAPAPSPPQLAAIPFDRVPGPSSRPQGDRPPAASAAEADPIARAKRAIAECRANYLRVRDYTCTFLKRERVDGRLTPQHVMTMKARTQPLSVYLKFQRPNAGREAIYIAGRHGGRALVHDVGLGKLLAGTLALDPRGARAMQDCRHPITEAGLGHLIDQIARGWEAEMTPGETRVVIRPRALVNRRPCTLIESTHPQKQPSFLFHQVKVYIDQELGLPIRFEAYDWPRRPGGVPELVEEYTFLNLRLNVGLRDGDFDAANPNYAFGRF